DSAPLGPPADDAVNLPFRRYDLDASSLGHAVANPFHCPFGDAALGGARHGAKQTADEKTDDQHDDLDPRHFRPRTLAPSRPRGTSEGGESALRPPPEQERRRRGGGCAGG